MIALVPELKDKLLEFTNSALSGDALSERERALAVLGAAFIIGDIEVVKKQSYLLNRMGSATRRSVKHMQLL